MTAMAVTSIWRVTERLDRVVAYVENADKTTAPTSDLNDVINYAMNSAKTTVDAENAPLTQQLVSGINCSPATARAEMRAVKCRFGKEGGTIAYHGYQSFAPGEATPEIAHEIGIKLAERLWGERYQVVIATHLDKENHLHSHFVLNTVSFVDGRKYHRTTQDYWEMQQVSDALCREYGLSVIEQPAGKSKPYAEWKAEQEHRPTIRDTIRADIDAAILANLSHRSFFNALAAKGYEFKLTGASGRPLKYPGIKPPGAKGFFRFSKLGKGYSLEEIDDRLMEKCTRQNPYPPKERQAVARERAAQPHYQPRVSGLRALYARYCYELHILVRHPASAKRVSIFMRVDLAKLERLDAQTRFLAQHNIETGEQLSAHRTDAEHQLAALTAERQALYLKIRRLVRAGQNTAAEKERRDKLTAKIKALRKEVGLCDSIAERSTATREELEHLLSEAERNTGRKTANRAR